MLGVLIIFTTHVETQSPCPCCLLVPGPERREATCGCTLPRMVGGHWAVPVPCPAAACSYNLHYPCHAAGAISVCWCCGLLQQPGECELGVWLMGAVFHSSPKLSAKSQEIKPPLLPGPRSPSLQCPPPLYPVVQIPSPSSLRPQSSGPETLLPEIWEPRSPWSPPLQDSGV